MPMNLAEIDWNTLLQKPDVLPLLLFLGVGGLVLLTAIIAVQWRKAQQATCAARLKERMIERGYSAEEIKTVLSAGGGRNSARDTACSSRASRKRIDRPFVESGPSDT